MLHFLCQSLQLEVLQSQTMKLCYERLGDYVRIEEYKPGRCITLSYWRELMTKDPGSELGYRYSVQVRIKCAPIPDKACTYSLLITALWV